MQNLQAKRSPAYLEHVCHTGGIYQLVLQVPTQLRQLSSSCNISLVDLARTLTVTFFCVTKQTESLPLTAMLVMPAALTALKAYSERHNFTSQALAMQTQDSVSQSRTDLVESTLGAKYGNVPVIPTASPRHIWFWPSNKSLGQKYREDRNGAVRAPVYFSDLTDAKLTAMSTTIDARLNSKLAMYLPVPRYRQRTIKVVGAQ